MFKTKEELTMKISELVFSYDTARMMSFFRKTLSNMLEFWTTLDKESLFTDNEWVCIISIIENHVITHYYLKYQKHHKEIQLSTA